MQPEPSERARASAPRGKLIVVSNRLPVTFEEHAGRHVARESAGGLAAALSSLPRDDAFTWIGWPGAVPADEEASVTADLARSKLVPVFLSAEEDRHYYRGVCNEVLWPLVHYATTKIDFRSESWSHYVAVNRRFADAVLRACGDGPARVWVHDFHLMLVPGMLRAARRDLEIGFFLHTPFPSSEMYRLLPTRDQVLEGLLGADHIGFHTSEYALHFRRACLRVLGLTSSPAHVEYDGRQIGLGTHPIGIDADRFQALLDAPETDAAVVDLRQRFAGSKLILGVERLDYTKGVPLKLDAFERVLERDPARAREVTLLQVLVPSRLSHPDYQELRRVIEQRVARVNGRFGQPGVVPVQYLHRSVSPHELAALYRFAHVGLVTPLRDGMNLVAQEYVWCQRDQHGVLVLSEFAGAAQVLSGALLVNPWNVDQVADTLEEALALDADEKRGRMRDMQRRVEAIAAPRWAAGFLEALARSARTQREGTTGDPVDEACVGRWVATAQAAPARRFLLDYDGTLRELTPRPELARPTDELLDLLGRLARLPGTQVHVVSGRDRATLGAWFDGLDVYLCADHGFSARAPGGEWCTPGEVDLTWMPQVRAMLDDVAADVPRTFVEEKAVSVAWHYRLAELDYGHWRALELQHGLEEALAGEPVEVIPGRAVVEVRAAGVNKGNYARHVLAESPGPAFVLAIGDDRTDDDLFRAVHRHGPTIQVGVRAAHQAGYQLATPAEVRRLLSRFVAELGQG